ncbi:MAG: ATP-binding protein [Bacteroidales bacterium]|nr:ATP-binding protein [Bacteroidales bacterium]
MKFQLSTNSNSVLNAGLTDDYRKAIAEYIWNGFDAGATCVEIRYHANKLGGVDDLWIIDNGNGIDYETLPNTFGAFLDSNKKQTFQRSSDVRGRKGKGRFSYNVISGAASWNTRYKDDEGNLKQYEIVIRSSNRAEYEATDPSSVLDHNIQTTGTVVHFLEMRSDLIEDDLTKDSFCDFLASEFAWFLILNKSKAYSIKIEGVELDYRKLIGEIEEQVIEVGELEFKCNFIRWTKKIGDKYYYYLMNANLKEVCKVLTSFNNKSTTFHHSLYVTSPYFNTFILDKEPGLRLDGQVNQSDETYRTLLRKLRGYLAKKEKDYIRAVGAVELIAQYERDGVLPKFSNDGYGQQKKKDLVEAIQGIYIVQPKIFLKLSTEQRKTMVGFLNLLLDSNERDNVIQIIESVVRLTPDERDELANTLRATTLSRINSAITLIKNRLLVIEGLKRLVYELEPFTTEREHIQKIVEENYWMFGEQYNLVTADKPFTASLLEYTYLLDGKAEKGSFTEEDGRRRPDIFISRSHALPNYSYTTFLEENIIVELKRPSVVIGKEQFRQIEDYRDIILKEPKFQSQRRKWTFIVVGKEVDDFIKGQYKSFADKNRPLLVQYQDNFEIYAMTWDDLFLTFEHRENFILDKLNFDKQVISDEVETYKKSREGSDRLTQDILALNTR